MKKSPELKDNGYRNNVKTSAEWQEFKKKLKLRMETAEKFLEKRLSGAFELLHPKRKFIE